MVERRSSVGPNEWLVREFDRLADRPRTLVDKFYERNPQFKRMVWYRLNAVLEFEGAIQGFVGDVSEMAEMPDNPSLWVTIGVMTNAGDFIQIYEKV